MADGWRCPECGVILAPAVTEHRCEPPAAGVGAPKGPDGGGPSLTEMGLRQIRQGVSSIDEVRERSREMPQWTIKPPPLLTPEQVQELTEAVQATLLQQARRNRGPRFAA